MCSKNQKDKITLFVHQLLTVVGKREHNPQPWGFHVANRVEKK
jgi:hypothetical protein